MAALDNGLIPCKPLRARVRGLPRLTRLMLTAQAIRDCGAPTWLYLAQQGVAAFVLIDPSDIPREYANECARMQTFIAERRGWGYSTAEIALAVHEFEQSF